MGLGRSKQVWELLSYRAGHSLPQPHLSLRFPHSWGTPWPLRHPDRSQVSGLGLGAVLTPCLRKDQQAQPCPPDFRAFLTCSVKLPKPCSALLQLWRCFPKIPSLFVYVMTPSEVPNLQ